MKITREEFYHALNLAIEGKTNYECNLQHIAGRWNFWTIHRVDIDGIKFYCATCCATANTDISVIKRVCARN